MIKEIPILRSIDKINTYDWLGNFDNLDEKFKAILREYDLNKFADQLLQSIRPRIVMQRYYSRENKDNSFSIGVSKLAGNPDVPEDFDWPYWKDRPLNFLMQINLGEIRENPANQFNLEKGMLYFFYDFYQEEDGLEFPKNKGAWRVIYLDESVSNLVKTKNPYHRDYFKSCKVTFQSDIHLPMDNAQLFKKELISWEDINEMVTDYSHFISEFFQHNFRCDNHALFGYADWIQGNGYMGDWMLLLQLGTDIRLKWMWGDKGNIYFFIKQKDLKKNHFNNIRFRLDCF